MQEKRDEVRQRENPADGAADAKNVEFPHRFSGEAELPQAEEEHREDAVACKHPLGSSLWPRHDDDVTDNKKAESKQEEGNQAHWSLLVALNTITSNACTSTIASTAKTAIEYTVRID
jgi:hypothetical protein